ncbi:MAG: hypothetical protein RR235_05005 [Oscillospiraceae bacterium]
MGENTRAAACAETGKDKNVSDKITEGATNTPADFDLDVLRRQLEIKERESAAQAEQIKQLIEAMNAQKPQVIQVQADTPKVWFRFQAEIADDNVVEFGPNGIYGRITGKTGSFFVPKDELSALLTLSVQWMIKNRWLLVMSGMTDEEMDAIGAKYDSKEVLDKQAFQRMIEQAEDIAELFPKLCTSNKEMVASRFTDAYFSGDRRVNNRKLIVRLNEMSKADYADRPAGDPRRRGLFTGIINAMNAKDAEAE